MTRVRTSFTFVGLTLLREWKGIMALAIAIYVAIPLVEFLDKDQHTLNVSLYTNYNLPFPITGEVRVSR